MRQTVLLALLCGLCSACGAQNHSVVAGKSGSEVEEAVSVSTGTVYALSLAERDHMLLRARAGDADAAYRLQQYYIFAGGEDGIGDDLDAAQARRWLEMAASRRHELARFDLAVLTAEENCRQARSVLSELRQEGSTPELRASADSWLQDPLLRC